MLSDKLFISDKVEEKSVELADGTTEVLFFKHLPNSVFERYGLWNASSDEQVKVMASSRLLALGLCEPDGKPAITAEQAENLKRPVMLRLLTALFEVNGFGGVKKDDPGKG